MPQVQKSGDGRGRGVDRINRFWAVRVKTGFESTPLPRPSLDSCTWGPVYSYSQTDFMARYFRMSGRSVFYPMGFDDNGLPTERLIVSPAGRAARSSSKPAGGQRRGGSRLPEVVAADWSVSRLAPHLPDDRRSLRAAPPSCSLPGHCTKRGWCTGRRRLYLVPRNAGRRSLRRS